MTIHWEKLLGVFVVSFGATVAVVALVTAGAARALGPGRPARPVRRAGAARPVLTRGGHRRGRGLPGGRRGDRAVRALGDRRPLAIGRAGPGRTTHSFRREVT